VRRERPIRSSSVAKCRAAVMMLLLSATVSACGALEFLYNRADWLATRYVDGLAELSDVQYEALNARFTKTLAWHREHELPRYVEILQDIEDAILENADSARVTLIMNAVDARWKDLFRRLSADVAPTLVNLSSEQLAYLGREFEERAQERQEKFVAADLDERRLKRQERILERTQDWAGELEYEQRVKLRAAIDRIPSNSDTWADYQRAHESRLLEMLQTSVPQADVQTFLSSWLSGESRSEALRKSALQWRDRLADYLVEVNALMSPDQRDSVLTRVRSYIAQARSAHAAT